jgi:hypothetical protein
LFGAVRGAVPIWDGRPTLRPAESAVRDSADAYPSRVVRTGYGGGD